MIVHPEKVVLTDPRSCGAFAPNDHTELLRFQLMSMIGPNTTAEGLIADFKRIHARHDKLTETLFYVLFGGRRNAVYSGNMAYWPTRAQVYQAIAQGRPIGAYGYQTNPVYTSGFINAPDGEEDGIASLLTTVIMEVLCHYSIASFPTDVICYRHPWMGTEARPAQLSDLERAMLTSAVNRADLSISGSSITGGPIPHEIFLGAVRELTKGISQMGNIGAEIPLMRRLMQNAMWVGINGEVNVGTDETTILPILSDYIGITNLYLEDWAEPEEPEPDLIWQAAALRQNVDSLLDNSPDILVIPTQAYPGLFSREIPTVDSEKHIRLPGFIVHNYDIGGTDVVMTVGDVVYESYRDIERVDLAYKLRTDTPSLMSALPKFTLGDAKELAGRLIEYGGRLGLLTTITDEELDLLAMSLSRSLDIGPDADGAPVITYRLMEPLFEEQIAPLVMEIDGSVITMTEPAGVALVARGDFETTRFPVAASAAEVINASAPISSLFSTVDLETLFPLISVTYAAPGGRPLATSRPGLSDPTAPTVTGSFIPRDGHGRTSDPLTYEGQVTISTALDRTYEDLIWADDPNSQRAREEVASLILTLLGLMDGDVSLTANLEALYEHGPVELYAFDEQGELLDDDETLNALSGSSEPDDSIRLQLAATSEAWARAFLSDLEKTIKSSSLALLRRAVIKDARANGQVARYRPARTVNEAELNLRTQESVLEALLSLTFDVNPAEWSGSRSAYSELLWRLLGVESIDRDLISAMNTERRR